MSVHNEIPPHPAGTVAERLSEAISGRALPQTSLAYMRACVRTHALTLYPARKQKPKRTTFLCRKFCKSYIEGDIASSSPFQQIVLHLISVEPLQFVAPPRIYRCSAAGACIKANTEFFFLLWGSLHCYIRSLKKVCSYVQLRSL